MPPSDRVYNGAMLPRFAIVLVFLLAARAWNASGQVPPGFPYDPQKHPNPIVTYVATSDFRASTFAEASEIAGLELLGLSQQEGRLESVDVALTRPNTRRVRIFRDDVDVTFYPVVRQTFALTGGDRLVLHSFRFPRLPAAFVKSPERLNDAALVKVKSADARFGLAEPPEPIEVRGLEGLIFDEGERRTVFWIEGADVHTATSGLKQEELLRLIEDLL